MQALPLVPKLQKCTRKLASCTQLMPGAWQLCRVQKRVPTVLSSSWVQQGTAGGGPTALGAGWAGGRGQGPSCTWLGSSALVLFEPCTEPCCSCSWGAAAPQLPLGSTLAGGSSVELAWCSLLPEGLPRCGEHSAA